jgi:hypothetical protein
MKRPVEAEFTSNVAYARALEAYCDSLEVPSTEPVAVVHETGFLAFNPTVSRYAGMKLYATPQRTWVGLTDEEAAECWTYNDKTSWRNIEAKLKEKNT